MSVELDLILSNIKKLSVEELTTIQETVAAELRQQAESILAPSQYKASPLRIRLPHAYQVTAEEIEASLAAIFTPEELAQLGKTDFSKLPTGPKSASEMLNEDREDRF